MSVGVPVQGRGGAEGLRALVSKARRHIYAELHPGPFHEVTWTRMCPITSQMSVAEFIG